MKAKTTKFVSRSATESVEFGIDQFFLQVVRMVVAAVRVGLPKFDHSVADARGVAVENTALDRDAFAARL